MSRPGKRTRTRTVAHFRRDDIDVDEAVSYEDIEVHEGRLHKTGINTVSESLPVRIPIKDHSGDSSAWMNLTSWSVSEDTDFALDPSDGRMYDQVLERDVMDEVDPAEQEGEVP